jgi:hypothetical protein
VERGVVESEPVERFTPAEEREVELARASNTGLRCRLPRGPPSAVCACSISEWESWKLDLCDSAPDASLFLVLSEMRTSLERPKLLAPAPACTGDTIS